MDLNPRAHDTRPRTIAECMRHDGSGIDCEKYTAYIQYQSDRRRRNLTALVAATYEEEKQFMYEEDDYDDDEHATTDTTEPPLKKTRRRRGVMARRTDDGELEIIQPEQSSWYQMYVNNLVMLEDDHFKAKFRNRFRLPYQNYLELVEDCKARDHFSRWSGRNASNKKSSPIELLVLGALRYLGRGWTFDDLEESTAVSRDVHRVFLHSFIDFGSTVLYERYVVAPMTHEEAKRHMAEFAEAGFPGCVGSTDCTHITTEKCEYNLKNNHLGAKSSHTTRTFNLTCNHRRKILHSTKGGPGRWNDQTMVRFDQFISSIRDGTVLQDVEFELYERDQNGQVLEVKYTGGHVIVDNGYLRWSCTVPPYKVTNNEIEIRWSRWLESMRKDVECTFGILKGRWRVLKTGIRLEGVDAVDKVWLTCCALHNWLLDIDGLDEEWVGGIPTSQWEGEIGKHDFDGVRPEVPNAIARISTNLEPRNYDLSGMGPGEDVSEQHPIDLDTDQPVDEEIDTLEGTGRAVKDIGLGFFRSKLVEHFDIMWRQNRIKWPSRRGPNPHTMD